MAYLAGAIDADGTIGVKRSTYAQRVRHDAGQAVYSERVAIRQVQDIVPRMLRAEFGGSLYITKPSTPGGRDLVTWTATDQRATACLRALLPYLRIKRLQADNALALRIIKETSKRAKVPAGRGHVGAIARPQHLTDEMERCYQTAKRLNRVGK